MIQSPLACPMFDLFNKYIAINISKLECGVLCWLFWRNKFIVDNSFLYKKFISAWFCPLILTFTHFLWSQRLWKIPLETLVFVSVHIGIHKCHHLSPFFPESWVLSTVLLNSWAIFFFHFLLNTQIFKWSLNGSDNGVFVL
jgi:hypothetical protein